MGVDMGLEMEHPCGEFLWRKLGRGHLFRRKEGGWPRPAAELFLSDKQDDRELLCILQGE